MKNEIEDNRQAREDKLFRILDHIMDKESKGELISLWEIYEDHGCPKYKTPQRVFSYPRPKEFIQHVIEKNDMQMDKVIKYDGKDILVEFELSTHYLREMDAYYWSLILDLTVAKEPNEFQKMCFEKWKKYD